MTRRLLPDNVALLLGVHAVVQAAPNRFLHGHIVIVRVVVLGQIVENCRGGGRGGGGGGDAAALGLRIRCSRLRIVFHARRRRRRRVHLRFILQVEAVQLLVYPRTVFEQEQVQEVYDVFRGVAFRHVHHFVRYSVQVYVLVFVLVVSEHATAAGRWFLGILGRDGLDYVRFAKKRTPFVAQIT